MNKASIRQQVLGLLNRNDCDNTLADTFIDQAVARIQRTLRVPAMEKSVVYTTNEEAANVLIIPNDFLSVKYLYCGPTLLEYVDLGRFLSQRSAVDTPRMYTRVQGELRLYPTPPTGTELVLVYHGEIPDLVNDTDENFLTVIAPDLLIYGALAFAANYFVDERKPAFEQEYARIYDELNEQAVLTEMSQSAMVIAPAYNTEY